MTTSVIIVDDHPAIRHGLTYIFEKCVDLEVLGSAVNVTAALQLVKRAQPDVVILDISLEERDGISLISQIKEECRKTHIIMYSMHKSKSYIMRSLKNGALGYILKTDKIEELVSAVRNVVQKKISLSSNISPAILSELITGTNLKEDITATLTPREFEIASLIARGRSISQISDDLFISPRTVRVHRTNIMHKLSCTNVHELLLQLPCYFPS